MQANASCFYLYTITTTTTNHIAHINILDQRLTTTNTVPHYIKSMETSEYANYLPDELLLEVLEYIEHYPTLKRQSTLARFCGVNRQWYDVAIRKLYSEPYLSGGAYELFVRTVCPSVIAHIKPSSLSGLVKCLDLSHIVHHGNKATTART